MPELSRKAGQLEEHTISIKVLGDAEVRELERYGRAIAADGV